MSHRILFVTEELYPLGNAQTLRLLVDGLIARGWEVHVAVLGQRRREPTEWLNAGIEVSYVNGDDTTPLHSLRDGIFVTKELRKLIASIAPEMVHAWCGQSRIFMLLATQEWPLVDSLPDFVGQLVAPQIDPPRLFYTELQLQPRQRFVRELVENKLSLRLERIVVAHSVIADQLIEEGVLPARIETVPPAIPVLPPIQRNTARQALRARLSLPESAYIAGTVAPLQPRSRLKDLVWATDLLACVEPEFQKQIDEDFEFHFVIIGEGSQLHRLKTFASQTEARTHVHFLGLPDEPLEVLLGLDVYWHSHLQDPLPSQLSTAMAIGLPAISVFGPGTEELIEHQSTAFAVNFGARDEFARWTKFLIENPEEAQQLAHQGRNFAAQAAPVAEMVDRMVAIYELRT